MKKESAFTGLEAAIVLIAFVVVAAVFSYVMLGAGFFATQKSQEVTYSGIKQSTSNVVLEGQLYGKMGGTNNKYLDELTFYIRVPEGGESVKMKDIKILYSVTSNAAISPSWSKSSSDNKLAPGANTQIVLTGLSSLSHPGPTAGSKFTLEIKPNVGASTLIQRTLSSGYDGGVII